MSEYIYTTEGTFGLRECTGEEIVRCKDCEYFCNHEHANGTEWQTCSYFDSEYAEVEPDGFCAWGERRASHDRD